MMPFDSQLFLRLFRKAFRDDPSTGRRRLLIVLAIAIPMVALVNGICFALDQIFFPGFRRVEIHDPIFIIGHPRSGTSLLHRIMSEDTDQFSWFMTYELVLPSLLQRKLVRGLGALDRRWLGGAIDARIRAWEDRVFARGREMHPMSLTGPEEDEFLMTIPFSSSTVSMIFPDLQETAGYQSFDRRLPERKRRRVMRYYRECVRRQLYLNGENRIHLSKNPIFCEKVKSLIETFPGARFVVCVRSPFETMPSIAKMMKRNWRAAGSDPETIASSLELLLDNSVGFYLHPLDDLSELSPDRWQVVRYEDLVERPAGAVRDVYTNFGLDVTAETEERLRRAENDARAYRPDHRYSLDEFGLTTEEIEKRLAPLFDRFEWPRPEAS
jgi:hypothetical protein